MPSGVANKTAPQARRIDADNMGLRPKRPSVGCHPLSTKNGVKPYRAISGQASRTRNPTISAKIAATTAPTTTRSWASLASRTDGDKELLGDDVPHRVRLGEGDEILHTTARCGFGDEIERAREGVTAVAYVFD